MYDLLIQIFLGWPAMIVSMGFALAGILLRKASLSLISTVLFLAPAWYLSHYSFVLGSLPILLVLSALAVARNERRLAFLSIVPILLVMGIFASIVLNQ